MTFEEKLVQWYNRNHRVLPFREMQNPYYVLVSEMMLQQTQVKTMIPYYERFIKTYPTLFSLSQAKEEDVLKQWEGLGYYSRAKNLLLCAKEVVDTYNGILPKERDLLLALKGIGPYMASALRAIGYDLKDIAVDGNLIRVYARLNKDSNLKNSKEMVRNTYRFFFERLKKESPSLFNQALMDLGELVCLPNGAPFCAQCPFKEECLAHLTHCEQTYPKKPLKKEKTMEEKTVVVLSFSNRFGIQKREEKLLHNLYQFKMIDGFLPLKELQKEYPDCLIKPLGTYNHVFSHLVWKTQGFLVSLKKEEPGFLYVTKEEIKEKYPLAKPFLEYLNRLD